MRFVVRPVLLILTVWLMAAPAALQAAETLPPRAQGLVQNLADEAVVVLSDSSSSAMEQAEKMRTIFRKYFAVEEIGRFVLSRYWRQATEAERAEYLQLFEDLIVYGYAKRFTGYAGEKLRVVGTRSDSPTVATVQSAVVTSGANQQITVDWEVEDFAGTPKIVDVSVEGVSLKLTQRSDFAGAIKQRGGKVSGLLDALRSKTESLKADIAKS